MYLYLSWCIRMCICIDVCVRVRVYVMEKPVIGAESNNNAYTGSWLALCCRHVWLGPRRSAVHHLLAKLDFLHARAHMSARECVAPFFKDNRPRLDASAAGPPRGAEREGDLTARLAHPRAPSRAPLLLRRAHAKPVHPEPSQSAD